MGVVVEKVGETWQQFSGSEHLDSKKVQSLVDRGIWTEADLAAHGLAVAQPAPVLEGQKAVGAMRIEEVGGKPVAVRNTVAVVRKIARIAIIASLTDQQLETFLSELTIRQQEMWYATTVFRADDPLLSNLPKIKPGFEVMS